MSMPELHAAIVLVFLVANGAVGAIIITALLRTRPGRNAPNKWLALLIGTLLILNLELTLRLTGLILHWPAFYRATLPLLYLPGPLIYFYIRDLAGTKFKLRWMRPLHFAPALVAVGLTATRAPITIPNTLGEIMRPPPGHYVVDIILPLVSLLIYLVLYYVELRKLRQVLKERFSNLEAIKMGWLSQILQLLGAAWFVICIREFLILHSISLLPIPIGISIVIFGTSYLALKRTPVISWDDEPDPATFKILPETVTPRELAKWSKEIISVMNEQKPYLNPDLTIADLAQTVGVSTYYLSHVINQIFHQTFSELVNSYRISELLQRTKDHQMNSAELVAKAQSMGFPSRAAFKSCFKSVTGKTPAQYCT